MTCIYILVIVKHRKNITVFHNHMYCSRAFADQGFEDTENANVFTELPVFHPGMPVHLSDTQHASLKRKKHEKGHDPSGSPGMEKSHSLVVDLSQRPLSMVVPSQSEANMSVSTSIGSLSRQVG